MHRALCSFVAVLGCLVVRGTLTQDLGANTPSLPTFQRVYSLRPREGVFAYSRISPDGHFLVYASEGFGARTINVVELETRRIVFSEPGIDAYWSPDGHRMIYQSFRGTKHVAIRNHVTGVIDRNVAPAGLGDYYSWARRDGRDLILTIDANYFYLDGGHALLPHSRVPVCPRVGFAARPLISKDGKRITTFTRGTIVVRNLSDCSNVFDTGARGAKADFSWDGRYIAYHAPRPGAGYDVHVLDLHDRTVRVITSSLAGSSYFPSWTKDGRLSFRYDGDDYRGFIVTRNVFASAAQPLGTADNRILDLRRWTEIFPETNLPERRITIVLVWATWSAHSSDALLQLERARASFDRDDLDVRVLTATDPGSRESDVLKLLGRLRIDLPRIPLHASRLTLTEAHNQMPATLLFVNGELYDRRLGAQTSEQLLEWLRRAKR